MKKPKIIVTMTEEDVQLMNDLGSIKRIGQLFNVICMHELLDDDVLEAILDDDELVNLFRRIKTPKSKLMEE